MDSDIIGLRHRLLLALGLVGGAALGSSCIETAPLEECFAIARDSDNDEIAAFSIQIERNEKCPSERSRTVKAAAKAYQGCYGMSHAKLRYVACGPLEKRADEYGFCEYVAVYDGPMHDCNSDLQLGRPFLIDAAPRLASTCERSDWALPSTVERPEDSRVATRLAAHWTDVALAEHASIAAFARFGLQLLSVGAPPELLRACQAAMLDETRHAQLAFGLASRFAGTPVGPSTIALERALADTAIESILRDVVLEGCLGETRAAAEARAAAAFCEQPEIRAVLEQVAADEERHAALAWRFVAWLLGQRPELRPAFERAIALALSSTQTLDANEADDRRFGVLDAATRRQIDTQVRSAIVAPLARALLVGRTNVPEPTVVRAADGQRTNQ